MTIQVQSNEPKVETPAAQTAEAKADVSKDASLSALGSETSEQKEVASDSETEAPEAKESESEVSESSEEESNESEAKDEAKERKPGKKKSGFERRIGKLNAQKAELEREKDYWKQEALKNATSKPETKVETKPVTPDKEPQPDDFDTHAAYVKAVAKWEAKQAIQESRKEDEQKSKLTEQKSQFDSHQSRLSSFKESHDDFDEVMENLVTVPRNAMLEQIIVSSKDGPELLYELAKNPDEAMRIAKLPPVQAALEMGKLSYKIASVASEKEKPTETKTITSAP